MARYYITFSCGHEGKVYVSGSEEQRKNKLAKLSEELCDECKKKVIAANRERESQHNKEVCFKYNIDFKKLKGTERQKRFGTDMRYRVMAKFLEQYHDDNRDWVIEKLLEEHQAYWWIECSKYPLEKIVKLLEEAEKRNIIYPDDSEIKDVVRLIIEDDELVAGVDYNYNVIQVLKKYGMSWEDWTKSWRLKYDETMVTLEERLIELGHKLLCAGIPVLIDDITLAEKTINGIYEPWHHKWILWDEDREMYLIKVPYGDRTMQNIRKWCKWDVQRKVWTLKGEAFRMIDDIKNMGYKISDNAEKARAKHEKAYRIMLADERVIKAKENSLYTKRIVRSEILEDLKDED